MAKLGLIGLGNLGRALGEQLSKASLVVFDRHAAKTLENAVTVASVADVVTMLALLIQACSMLVVAVYTDDILKNHKDILEQYGTDEEVARMEREAEAGKAAFKRAARLGSLPCLAKCALVSATAALVASSYLLLHAAPRRRSAAHWARHSWLATLRSRLIAVLHEVTRAKAGGLRGRC